MILLCKLAAAVLVAAVLTLLLKKDQPAFALLVSVCTAAGLLAVAMHQIEPLLAWLRTLEVYFQGAKPGGAAARPRHCAGRAVCRRHLPRGRSLRGLHRHRALRPGAGAFAGSAAAAVAARLLCGLFAVIFLLAVPPPAFADELPQEVQDILQDSPADITDAAGWTLADIAALLGDWIISGFQPTLHFAAQSAGYLLLAGLLGLLVGRPAGAYVEILAVLGFGSLSLSTAMQLTALVGSTAQDCSTYLTAFVPVFGGVAAAGGQTSGALVYSGMFFAMSGFLCAVIRKLLLPVMQIYFCFSVCACLWGNHGITDAAALFARCMHWLLKVCGALFSLVLGLQNTLAATVDNAALRTRQGPFTGRDPGCGGCRCRRTGRSGSGAAAAQRVPCTGRAASAGGALCTGLSAKHRLYARLCGSRCHCRGYRAKALCPALPTVL